LFPKMSARNIGAPTVHCNYYTTHSSKSSPNHTVEPAQLIVTVQYVNLLCPHHVRNTNK